MDQLNNVAPLNLSEIAAASDEATEIYDISPRSALDDARHLIKVLGPDARRTVATGATSQFGEWLGWPDWFKQNTTVESELGLPAHISLADDLILIANIVDHGKSRQILSRLTDDFRIPGAPITVPALYNAPTLLDALEFFVRTAAFGSPFLKVDFRRDDEKFSINIGSDLPRGEMRDFCASAMLSIAYRFVSFFVIDDVDDIKLSMEPSKSNSTTSVFEKLPCQILLNANFYALYGKAHWLRLENSRTDKAFWNFALERMSVAEREGNKSDLVRRIRSAVCQTMESEGRVPRLKQIAASEGISERTLVRALALQGIRFQQILEEERRIKAAALIGDSAHSLAEIARMLGFTDMSSFGRSYRHWFGLTPGQARMRRGN